MDYQELQNKLRKAFLFNEVTDDIFKLTQCLQQISKVYIRVFLKTKQNKTKQNKTKQKRIFDFLSGYPLIWFI